MSKETTVKEQAAYAEAGGVAEEVISAIRTVVAFGGQEKECARYDKCLEKAKTSGIKKGFVSGLAMGTVMLIVFLSYAVGFYVGTGIVLGRYLPELHTDFSIGRMLIVSHRSPPSHLLHFIISGRGLGEEIEGESRSVQFSSGEI